MNNKKGTKRALLTSLLMLLLSCSMFVGSTFAWFTDSVVSRNNVITSGNLDVEMEYSFDGTTWAPVTEDTTLFAEDALWEPGHTQAVAVKVKNVGTLAVKYALSTTIFEEIPGTNVYDQEFKLSDSLEVYSCAPQGVDGVGALMAQLCLENRNSAIGNGTIMAKTAFNSDLATDDNLDVNEEHIIVLAITMPTTVKNEANYKTGTTAPKVSFGVNLYATQAVLEEDSFGPDYDKDAEFALLPEAGLKTWSEDEINALGQLTTVDGTNTPYTLNTAYTFSTTETYDEAQESPYRFWNADFVVTFDKDVAAESAGLSGSYASFQNGEWIGFLIPMDVTANEAVRLLDYAGIMMNYEELCLLVEEFHCGAFNLDSENVGTTMKVELRLYETEPKNDVNGSTNVETGNYVVINQKSYTFE